MFDATAAWPAAPSTRTCWRSRASSGAGPGNGRTTRCTRSGAISKARRASSRTSRGAAVVRIDGIDDAAEFATQLRALDALGVTDRQDVLDIVAAVLHLGCAEFDGDDARCVNAETSIGRCAPLLGLDATEVETAVTTRTERMGRGSIVTLRLTTKQARSARTPSPRRCTGASSTPPRPARQRVAPPRRLADEQQHRGPGHLRLRGLPPSVRAPCINYANEKLQLSPTRASSARSSGPTRRRAPRLAHVQFEDNARCVALFDGRVGHVNALLGLLDDECAALHHPDAASLCAPSVFGASSRLRGARRRSRRALVVSNRRRGGNGANDFCRRSRSRRAREAKRDGRLPCASESRGRLADEDAAPRPRTQLAGVTRVLSSSSRSRLQNNEEI